jgi:hypothetical protein
MPQQVKFGLLLVCVLTGTFGVLVYKRLHKPADLAAGTDSDPAAVAIADGHPPASTPVVEVADLDQLPLAVVPPPARTVSQPDPVEADDPFATEPVIAKPVAAVGTPSTPPQTTTKLPVDLDEEFFAAPVAAQPVKPFPAAAATPQDMVETDPFAEEPIRAQPVAQSPQTTDADPFDPFGDESAPTAVKSAPVTQSVEAEFDPFADVPEQAEPVSVSSRSAAVPAEPVIERRRLRTRSTIRSTCRPPSRKRRRRQSPCWCLTNRRFRGSAHRVQTCEPLSRCAKSQQSKRSIRSRPPRSPPPHRFGRPRRRRRCRLTLTMSL